MHVLEFTLPDRTGSFEPQDMLRQPRAGLSSQTVSKTCVLGLEEARLTKKCVGEGELLGFLLEII